MELTQPPSGGLPDYVPKPRVTVLGRWRHYWIIISAQVPAHAGRSQTERPFPSPASVMIGMPQNIVNHASR